jgi:hypothetical protein
VEVDLGHGCVNQGLFPALDKIMTQDQMNSIEHTPPRALGPAVL